MATPAGCQPATQQTASVYVLTAYLVLDCLDAETGQVQWSKDLCQQYGGRLISWQNAASPLIENGLVIVNKT